MIWMRRLFITVTFVPCGMFVLGLMLGALAASSDDPDMRP